MKVLSFDVGIKNLAYCLFDQSTISDATTTTATTTTIKWKIADWKVVSLLGEEPVIHKCSSENLPKNKKTVAKPCSHLAKYHHKEIYLCDKHAKALRDVYLPQPRFKHVKKMKMEELVALALELKVDSTGKKKPDLLKDIQAYLDNHVLQPVSKSSAKAGDADMITLGQAMKRIFIEFIREHPDLSVVLIENQISPLANRMKTIQGMLAQTFIMLLPAIRVEFISSANKLKMFSPKETPVVEETVTTTQSQKYQAHKKDGVTYCHETLQKGIFEGGEQWTLCERKKKDDLADCFLQGVWWLKRENHIHQ
jgi:Mitochondrial resolvase Ydc2 / RNA splicing MRS1